MTTRSESRSIEESLEQARAERDEAYAILWAMNHEYDKDEQCDGRKINTLIERGHVLLSDGPVTSKSYWACWGGEGEESAEDQAEYARYCDRAMETQELRWRVLELEHAKSSETRESLQLVPVQSRNEILEEAALAIENADTRTLDEIGAAYIVRALQVRSK